MTHKKKRRGRPQLPGGSVTIAATITPKDASLLDAWRAERSMGRSAAIREMIRHACRANASHEEHETPTISDSEIDERLDQTLGCRVEWTGHVPADATEFDQAANDRLNVITIVDVRAQLNRNEYHPASVRDVIDAAIGDAAAPEDLPDSGCIVVIFAN